ncbi:MAG: GNAT family N-acetyltransferase [Chitinophagales bacterium]|nr:GNAT family N-acetyltransferase [Chitinophagales bacterium]
MIQFSDTHIRLARTEDAEAIVLLLNSAYRGEQSRKGWTTEADLIAGDVRTDMQNLLETMQLPGSIFLVYSAGNGTVTGCVNLQQHGNHLYLGMFSVSPEAQGAGIGKTLLLAAEEYAAGIQCQSIYMSVISVREELISWYKRHGYRDTGERIPFKEDGLTGRHLRPLEFMRLEKSIATQLH